MIANLSIKRTPESDNATYSIESTLQGGRYMKKNKIKLISNAFDEKFRRHFSFDPFVYIFYFFSAFTTTTWTVKSNLLKVQINGGD